MGANAPSEPILALPLNKECFLFSPDANLEVTDVISTEMHAVWKIGKSAAIAACGVVAAAAALAGCACRDMATTAVAPLVWVPWVPGNPSSFEQWVPELINFGNKGLNPILFLFIAS